MNKNGYLPTSDAGLVIWMNNFKSKIGTYAPITGITPAEVTSVTNDAAFFQYIVNSLEVFKQTAHNVTQYKNLLKHAVGQQHIGAVPSIPALGIAPTAVTEGVFDRVSKLVQRIKASLNYTENMGQDLGIVAPSVSIDPETLQPVLTIKLDAGRPHIKSNKSIADAIDLYVDRKTGTGFVLIARLLKLEFIDTATLSANALIAEWEYKAMYVIGNDNVGIMSSPVSILVKKM